MWQRRRQLGDGVPFPVLALGHSEALRSGATHGSGRYFDASQSSTTRFSQARASSIVMVCRGIPPV